MTKALSSICLVLLICFGGSAWAGKTKIAVLGLEAIPGPSGAVDAETAQVAREITKELRQRAASSTSPYVIAPNSSKELTDEKLLMSCDNEAVGCMVVIGAGLAAEVVLYGRVERKGDVYRVSIKLLDVKAKTVQPIGDDMPVGGSSPGVAKRIFNKLTGDSPAVTFTGTLVVKAKSQSGVAIGSGVVMVDEERRGKLAGGKLTISGIAEGRHTVAIEAGGYRRFEESVIVHGGEQASLEALLIDKGVAVAPAPSRSSKLPWKVSLGVSIAVAVVGASFTGYSYAQTNKHFDRDVLLIRGEEGAKVQSEDCGNEYATIIGSHTAPKLESFSNRALHRACIWRNRIYMGYVVGGVGVLGTAASLIMLIRNTGPSEQSSEQLPTGARSKKPDVAIVPILTPDVAGASLSMSW